MTRTRFWLFLSAILLLAFTYALISWSQAASSEAEAGSVVEAERPEPPETIAVTNDEGQVLASHARPVTAVTIKNPARDDYWQVTTITDEVTAWVATGHVYESPEWEFLFGLAGTGHTHGRPNAPW